MPCLCKANKRFNGHGHLMEFRQQMPIKVWALVVYDKPKACLGKAWFVFKKIDVCFQTTTNSESIGFFVVFNKKERHGQHNYVN
jgi:hypothetical protein